MLASAKVQKAIAPSLLHKRADYVRNHYCLLAPAGYTLADMLLPETWLHATKLQRFDRVEVIAVDGSFDADLRVEAVGHGFCQMRVLRAWHPEVEPASESAVAGARVGFSPISKWRLFGHDGMELARGYNSKADAETALAAFLEEVPLPVSETAAK